MKLKKLLKGISVEAVKGSKEVEITGICSNSQLIIPGNLFIAKKGLKSDGARFISEAISAGAVAVVTDIYNPFLENVVQIIHPDVSSLEASLAARYYHFSKEALDLIGITGTNGKTTCSYLVKHLLEGLSGHRCGVIGTIEWNVGKQSLPSTHTCPDVITNYKLFHEMVSHHCTAAVMEVSSHALDQGRVRGIPFRTAIFTNLTSEHLDYHQTMDAYAAAKAKLFTSLEPHATAIVNVDSPWHSLLIKDCSANLLTYGIDNAAAVRASHIVSTPKGVEFQVSYQGETLPFSCGLIGRFNVYNCLAAIAFGLSRQVPLKQILSSLRSFKRVPGRLERVANKRGLHIFVDYAHKYDALKNVLETLNEMKKKRLITVFGCGGDRDRLKRPKMGEVASDLSDFTLITTDNPRSEDPEAIIKEILKGVKDPKRVWVEPDRSLAIHRAIQMATPDDIVLIAGKGHETYQIFAHHTIDFDDRKVAAAAADECIK